MAMIDKYAIIYTRVSTDQQADSGLGLEAQRAACVEYCEARGWTWEVMSDPGCSGAQINPELQRALGKLAARRADVLVTAKMDRIARSVTNAADLLDRAKRQGWALAVVDIGLDLSTTAGRAMAQMLAVFAEMERALIGARISEAAAAKKARGEHVGRRSVIPPMILNRIVYERDQGRSFNAIATGLTADDVVTPGGRREWQSSTVRRAYSSAKAKEQAAGATA